MMKGSVPAYRNRFYDFIYTYFLRFFVLLAEVMFEAGREVVRAFYGFAFSEKASTVNGTAPGRDSIPIDQPVASEFTHGLRRASPSGSPVARRQPRGDQAQFEEQTERENLVLRWSSSGGSTGTESTAELMHGLDSAPSSLGSFGSTATDVSLSDATAIEPITPPVSDGPVRRAKTTSPFQLNEDLTAIIANYNLRDEEPEKSVGANAPDHQQQVQQASRDDDDKSGENRTLVLKNLPFSTKPEEVHRILNSCPHKPKRVVFLRFENGNFKGTVLAKYQLIEEAIENQTFLTSNGSLLIDGREVVVVFKAPKKRTKKASKEKAQEEEKAAHYLGDLMDEVGRTSYPAAPPPDAPYPSVESIRRGSNASTASLGSSMSVSSAVSMGSDAPYPTIDAIRRNSVGPDAPYPPSDNYRRNSLGQPSYPTINAGRRTSLSGAAPSGSSSSGRPVFPRDGRRASMSVADAATRVVQRPVSLARSISGGSRPEHQGRGFAHPNATMEDYADAAAKFAAANAGGYADADGHHRGGAYPPAEAARRSSYPTIYAGGRSGVPANKHAAPAPAQRPAVPDFIPARQPVGPTSLTGSRTRMPAPRPQQAPAPQGPHSFGFSREYQQSRRNSLPFDHPVVQ